MDAIKHFTEGMIKENKPQFEVGDTVRVSVRIKEGDKERIQAFEGTVIAKKHGGIAETFTVRRTSYGVGRQGQGTHLSILQKRGGRLAFSLFSYFCI